MFEILKLRFFISKVQAELMAQYRDQKFVNTVCHLPSNMEQLSVLYEHAYYRKEKIAPFMAACHVLGESLESDALNIDTKTICATLLAQRLQKSASDRHFHMRHFQIFGDLERKLEQWSELQNA
jgi:hypothetical protein